MKIMVLGSNGMLGHMMVKYLKSTGHTVHGLHRGQHAITKHSRPPTVDGYDFVINCIGLIKPRIDDIEEAVLVNAVFPHQLAMECVGYDAKMIHISTDCTFSGNEGLYSELSPQDATDVYGKTKSLGEPDVDTCMTLKTSIIGPEVKGLYSLYEWVKNYNEPEIMRGYTNHLWNGMTTLTLAMVCDYIIEHGLWHWGTYHIFTEESVTKYELLNHLLKHLGLSTALGSKLCDVPVDRRLSTVKRLNGLLSIKPIKYQLELLHEFTQGQQRTG